MPQDDTAGITRTLPQPPDRVDRVDQKIDCGLSQVVDAQQPYHTHDAFDNRGHRHGAVGEPVGNGVSTPTREMRIHSDRVACETHTVFASGYALSRLSCSLLGP